MRESKPGNNAYHPGSLILFTLFWTLTACLIDQPLVLLLLAAVFSVLLLRLRQHSFLLLGRLFIFILPILLLVNLLFSTSGYTPLLELPWGRTVMIEPLLFSGVMLLKVLLVTAIFLIALSLGQRSEIIRWMLRHLPQTGVLCSTALAGMPAIQDQFQRSRFALESRFPEELPKSQRLHFLAKLWLPLLHYVLGCALHTSDVLNARAWGTGPRSCYRLPNWQRQDRSLAITALAGFLITAAGAWVDVVSFPWQASGFSPYAPLAPEIIGFTTILVLPLALTAVLTFHHDRTP
jgi:energy-coupling factor transport system permease protein